MKTKKPSLAAFTLISSFAVSAAFAQVAAPGATASGAANAAAAPAANVNAPAAPVTTPAQNSAAVAAQNAAAGQQAANASTNVTPVVSGVNSGVQTAPTLGAQAASSASTSVTTLNGANGTSNSMLNSGTGATTNSSANTPAEAVNSSLAGSAVVQGDVPSANRNNLNSNARTDAAANGQINGLATGAELSNGAAATLSPAETIRDIRGATQSSRDTLYTQVNGKIENTGRVISDLNHQARELKGDAKAPFKAAMADLHDKERSLKHSLNAVRRASNDGWSDAQNRLAADYEAYATAIARAQAAATVNDGNTVTR